MQGKRGRRRQSQPEELAALEWRAAYPHCEEANQAEDRQQLVNDGKRHMQEFASKDHANTGHKNGNEEPADDP
jgi:hypothetical protein